MRPGDFVTLHFSGHGAQAPTPDPSTKLDGLDEPFPPVNTGPWSDGVGAVENALVDDEIGALIDGLRAMGADVWAVFDSCHSGSVTRAVETAEADVRTRQLPPEVLGSILTRSRSAGLSAIPARRRRRLMRAKARAVLSLFLPRRPTR